MDSVLDVTVGSASGQSRVDDLDSSFLLMPFATPHDARNMVPLFHHRSGLFPGIIYQWP
jgi:hypothetical protein